MKMQDQDQPLPPHSLEAERAVLGAMLLARDACDVAIELLVAEDFYREAHQLIFSALSQMRAEGNAVDELLLRDHLQARGELDQIGGPEAIRELSDVTSSALIESHARIVMGMGIRRRIVALSHETLREAMHPAADSEYLIESLERRLVNVKRPELNGTVSIGDAAAELLVDLESGDDEKAPVILTGFGDLDDVLKGFGPGQLVILAGRPSMGKTTLAINIALNIAATGTPVLFYSLEMEIREIVLNAIRCKAGIPFYTGADIRTDAAWDSVASAVEKLKSLPFIIESPPTLTPSSLRSHARRMSRQGKAGFIIIDYVQLMDCPQKGKRESNRVEELERVSLALKALAKELQVPVLALAQLNREAVRLDNIEPELKHLKGSGAFEQDAHTVMFIYQPKGAQTDSEFGYCEIAIKVAKNRNGPIANRIPLTWFKAKFRFESVKRM